ncbi:MAG: NAD(+)/NADH kinase [Woeseiaceae bacterium]|nr:NAD(+)/NADH kinase [Woeseiaceae bacterium]
MAMEFQKIAVLGSDDDPRVVEPKTALVEHLTKVGAEVADTPRDCDLVITIGGDGTLLAAAHDVGAKGTPLLGINRGRLGFLADITPDEMIESVDQVLAGDYSRDSRLQLEASLETADGDTVSAIALNDVVLQRRETGRMVDFETRVGDHYVNTHAGDGLIVSTPTGSTAYALSCGGPILQPQIDAMVIVPICPHTLTDRPIVIPANEGVQVKVLERDETKAEVAVDGRSIGDITAADRLVVRAAASRTVLIHPPGYDFYGILRSKLFWGRDSRVRGPGG